MYISGNKVHHKHKGKKVSHRIRFPDFTHVSEVDEGI